MKPLTASPSVSGATPKSTPAEREALVREAVARYTALNELNISLSKQGGLPSGAPVPAALTKLATGQALDYYVKSLRDIKTQSVRWSRGDATVWGAKEAESSSSPSPGAIVISGCIDASRVLSRVGASPKESPGRAVRAEIVFTQEPGGLKATTITGGEDAECIAK